MVKPVDIKDDRLKEAKGYILKAIANRKITDRIVSWVWILVLILIFIGSIALSVVISIISYSSSHYYGHGVDPSTIDLLQIGSIVMSIAPLAVLAYLTFVLVRRQNEHFARDRALREGIIQLLRTASDPTGRSSLVMNELAAMNAANGPREEHHDERIWALFMFLPLIATFGLPALRYLSVIGTSTTITILSTPIILLIAVGVLIAVLYLFYFLGKQMYEHDERWLVFEQNSKSIMTKLRWPPIIRTKQVRLEKREFAIYLVVSIIIFPFMLYWLYTLIKDPNTHFESQWEFEDRLAEIIRK